MYGRVLRPALFLIALGALLALPLAASAGDRGVGGPAGPSDGDERHAPERVLVKFKAGTSAADQRAVHRRHGGTVVEEIAAIGVQVTRAPRPKDRPQDASHEGRKAREYGQEPSVEFAEVDGAIQAQSHDPLNPLVDLQWALAKIQASSAWGSCASGVKVAILDTGIDQNHEDLVIVGQQKNFSSSKTVDDTYGHGTHVGGIVGASTNNGKGVAAVAPCAQLMNVKVLKDNGDGFWSWVANGITWAADPTKGNAKVINMSLGATTGSSTLAAAVDYAWGKNVALVAAAGNQSGNFVLYPAAYAKVIAVASLNKNDQKSDFSNYGAKGTNNDYYIVAWGGQWDVTNNFFDDPFYDWKDPNVGVESTMPNHTNHFSKRYGDPVYPLKDYGALAGTSMATPEVAGVAAILRAKCPSWTVAQVWNKLKASAIPITVTDDPLLGPLGIGRLNAYNAVQGAC